MEYLRISQYLRILYVHHPMCFFNSPHLTFYHLQLKWKTPSIYKLFWSQLFDSKGWSMIISKELFKYKWASLQRSDMFFLFVTLMVSFCLSKNYVKRGQTDASDAHSLFIQLKTMSTNKSGSPQDNSPNLGIDFMTQ